jgi:hypothetical protein
MSIQSQNLASWNMRTKSLAVRLLRVHQVQEVLEVPII